MLSGCCGNGERADLLLDIRTDLVAGVEFVRVRVERFEQVPEPEELAAGVNVRERAAGLDEPFVNGVRAAVFENLKPGNHVVRARLVDGQNAIVLERIAILTVRRTSVYTLVMTRDCRGVQCPGAADDPSLVACVGGRCVRPECTPEQPEFCPSFSCEVDASCVARAACGQALCTSEQVCLLSANRGECPADQYCDPDVGCTRLPDEVDGGLTSDAGIDGGPPIDADADAGAFEVIPWGQWAASLEVPPCPAAPELVVDSLDFDLEGGNRTMMDPSDAGPTLSLAEAIFIAFNRAGPDTIRFSEVVFPVDAPGTVLVDQNHLLSQVPLTDTCLDARERGVVVDFSSCSGSGCLWLLDSGSLQVGLTLLALPAALRIELDAQVAGCRFNTDGETGVSGTSSQLVEILNRQSTSVTIVGPGNVFVGTQAVFLTHGRSSIIENYFGYDPITRSVFRQLWGLWINGLEYGFGPPDVDVVGNHFASQTTVAGGHERVSSLRFEQNFFGQTADGMTLSSAGFSIKGSVTGSSGMLATFGPGNLVTQTGGGVHSDIPIVITQNSIFGTGSGITYGSGAVVPPPPVIAFADETQARGTCGDTAGTVELFSDAADQGELLVGTTACTDMAWDFAGAIPRGRNVTATLTVNNATSVFSAPFAVP